MFGMMRTFTSCSFEGVSLLSQVLEKCPRDKVNRQSSRLFLHVLSK